MTDTPQAAGPYRQELKRSLGSFQVFAISFAFISVAVGVFGTYEEVLTTGGPVAIWLWVVVAIGQTLVALVVAQFAARIALTGSSYQWASRLANPKVGWGFGWLSVWWLGLGSVAVANAMANEAVMPLFELAPDEGTGRLLTVVILFVEAVLVIASTRIVGIINASAVGVELTIIVVLIVVLTIAVATSGVGSVDNLTSRGVTEGQSGYFGIGGGLMLAMIMGLTTLVGFDAAANLAEEAKDPYRSVPRAIVGSTLAAGVVGFIFLLALTIAIPDVTRISASGSPVAEIMRVQLGSFIETVLLVAINFAFFAAGLVTIAAGARLVFAMARDGRFPGHRVMARVNPRTQTPIPATLLFLVAGVVLMVALPGKALIELITTGTILPVLIYGGTVVLYLVVRRRLERKEGGFSLGRFELPIAVAALAWLFIALFVLVTPGEALTPVLLVLCMFVLGGVFFAAMWFFNREVLEVEPGAGPAAGPSTPA